MTHIIALLILTTVLIYIISTLSEHVKKDESKQLKEITLEIKDLEKQREQLTEILEMNQIDTSVQLQKIVVQVLNEYEHLEIKIPADILESLSVMTFESEKEVKATIEKLRHAWKLENSKKI